MKKIVLILMVGIVAFGITYGVYRAYFLEGTEPTECHVCARPIRPTTAFSMMFDSKEIWCCCPRCALALVGNRHFDRATATDYLSGKHAPAERCLYVEGADLMPCCAPSVLVVEAKDHMERCFDRCSPSVIAFAVSEQAVEFAKQHGGSIVNFDTLLEEARR